MSKKIVFMRGIPGSGKTPWALEHFDYTKSVILSSADYFLDGKGRYRWVAKKTPESHAWNQSRFLSALKNAVETIVVDNTNIKAWEMQEYLNILENYPEYEVFQKVMEIDPEEAEFLSVHKVPLYALDRMDREFEVIDTMPHYNG